MGAPREKLVLGIPFYGKSFKLRFVSDAKIGSSSTGAGQAGPYSQKEGIMGYNEICVMLSKGKWNTHFDEEQQTPYMVKGDQWIGYESIA